MPRHEFTPAEAAAAGRHSGMVRQRKAEARRQRIEAERAERATALYPPSEAPAGKDDAPNTEPLQERLRPTKLEDIVVYGYSP